MLTFNNPSNVDDASNALLELDGATGVTTAVVNGTTYVFVAGNVDDGISVFSLAANGTLTNVFNIDDASNAALELDGAIRLTTAVVGGTTYLFSTGNADNGVSVFSVASNGALTNVFNVTDGAGATPPLLTAATGITTALSGGNRYLIATSIADDAVSVFSVAANGALTLASSVVDDGTVELDGAAAVTTAIVGGITYVFVAGSADDGVSTFRLNVDGSLTNIAGGNVTDAGALELDGVQGLTTAVVGGTTYLFTAAGVDNGVSVFSVAANGNLTNVFNVTDAGALELAGAIDLTTAVVNGTTYLYVAGSGDAGVSVFSVAVNGALTNVSNISDAGALELQGVAGVATANVGATTYVIGAGSTDDGVSVLDQAAPSGQYWTVIGGAPADTSASHVNNDGSNATLELPVHTEGQGSIGLDLPAGYYFTVSTDHLFIESHRISDGVKVDEIQIANEAGAGSGDDDLINALVVDAYNEIIYVGLWGQDEAHTGIVKVTYNPTTGLFNDNAAYGTGGVYDGDTEYLITNTGTGGDVNDIRYMALDTNGTATTTDDVIYYSDVNNGSAFFNGPTNQIYSVNVGTGVTTQLSSNSDTAGGFPTDYSRGYIGPVALNKADGLIYFMTHETSTNAAHLWRMPIGGGLATEIAAPAGHTFSIGDYPTAGLTFDSVREQLYITVQSNIPQGFTVDEVIQAQMSADGLSIASVVDSYLLSELVGHTPDPNAHAAGGAYDQLPVFTKTDVGTAAGEQGGGIDVLSTVTITDLDNDHLASATVVLSGGFAGSGDLFFVLDGGEKTSGTFTGTNISIAQSTDGGGNITLTLTGYDTLANYQSALNAIGFRSTGDNPTNYGYNETRTINWTVSDGAQDVPFGGQNTGTTTLSITAVNDGPTNNLPGAPSINEDAQTAITGITISDPDVDPANQDVTVTFSVQHGTLNVLTTVLNGIIASDITGGAQDSNSITITAPINSINATIAANGLRYTGDLNFNTTTGGAEALHIVTSDNGHTGTPGALGDTDDLSITVNPQNDTPDLTNVGPAGTSTEQIFSLLDTDAAVSDVDLDALNGGAGLYTGASLAIARNGGANASDDFDFDTSGALFTVNGGDLQSGGLTFATFTDVGGTLTVNFTSSGTAATSALVDDVIQHISYRFSTDDPPANVTLTYTFNDGSPANSQGGGAQLATDTGSIAVAITAVNDEPTLTATGNNPTFTEGGAAADLYSTVTASAIEAVQTLTSMTLTVSNVTDGANEVLNFDGSPVALTNGNAVTTATNGLNVTVSLVGTTATVTFSGATLSNAQLQAVVDGLTYSNTSSTPTDADRIVTITELVDSGSNTSPDDNTATPNIVSIVNVNPTNDPPVLAGIDATPTYDENGSALVLDATLTVSDNDDTDIESATIAIAAGFVAGDELSVLGDASAVGIDSAWDPVSHTLKLTGTSSLANYQEILKTVAFFSSSDDPTNGGASTSRTITWTINDGENDNNPVPALTLNIAAVNDEPTLTATPTNPTYAENSVPATLFSAAAASTIEAGQTITSMTLTVAGLADGANELLFIDGSNVALTNGNVVVTATNGLTVNVSVAGNTATVSFTGASLSGSALQTLVNALGYSNTDDTPTEGLRTITITQLVDSGSNTAPNDNTSTLFVTSLVDVTATNDAPSLTGLTDTPAFVENGSSVLLDANGNAAVNDPELEAAGNYAGATLTIQRSGGANSDDSFGATGSLDLTNSNGLGENVSLDAGTTFIGTFVDNGDGSISFTFNANATAADINQVMRQIVYANASDNPPTVVPIDFVFNDGNGLPGGQAQGAGAGETIATVNVQVTQINDRPIVASVAGNASYAIGSAGVVLSPSLLVSDVDSTAPSTNVGIKNAVVAISDGYLPGDQLFANLPTSGGFFIVDDGSGPVVTNISVQSNSFGRLVLTGTDTALHYQLVLDAVSYRSTATDPSDNGLYATRTITWQVNDGAALTAPLLAAPGPTYATNGSPFEGLTLDMNHDNVLDLVVTTAAGISVLLGNGNGTFGTKVDTSLGTSPRDIAAADLNHDGDVDLAVAGFVGGVSVLLGDGGGGFTASPIIPTGAGATGVAIADFNGDGHADIVVTNALSNNVSVLFGTGTGTFAAIPNIPVGTTPVAVTTGDFNGDGRIDIAAADQTSNDVAILLNNGVGGFAAATTFGTGPGTAPIQIATADLDGDGDLDLVTANSSGNNISVLLGNGAGGFGGPTTFATGNQPHDVSIGDVDGDGRLDIVTADVTGTGISFLHGNGNGTFAVAAPFAAGPGAAATMLGDYDRNGALDVAVANFSASNISILLGSGTNNNAPVSTLLQFDQPPTVDLDTGAAGFGFVTTFTENGAAVAIANAPLINDPDTAALDSLTITLTNAKAGDVLSVLGALPAGIDSSIDTSVPGTIRLSLFNSASFADYQTALGQVRFSNGSENPDITDRDITVEAVSVEAHSNIAHATVHVVSVNDAPINTVPGVQSTLPNTNKTIAGLAVSDPDAASGSLTTTLSVLHGILTVAAAGGAAVAGSGTASVTLTGTLAQINTTLSASGNVVYKSDPGFNGSDTLTVLTNDAGNTGTGGAQGDTDTVTIVVSAPPTITSNGGGDAATIDVLERTTAVTTVVASDPDSPVLNYSIIGGSDAGKFQINGASGALSFISGPNFDVPADADHNNSYIVQVRASDGTLTDDQLITVQVTDDPNVTSTVHWIKSVDVGPHPAGWLPAGNGDFNGDGTDDLAWFNAATGNLDIWKFSNGAWAGSSNVGSHPAGYQPVGFGDYNGDGVDDVLWFNPTTRDVDLWKIVDGQWAGSVNIGTHPAGYTPSLSGDFNGDGTSDVLWYNPTTNAVDIWKINGGQWAGSVDVGTHPAGYTPALAGDFNGDGTDDVLWYNPTTGAVDVWKLSNGQWAGSVAVGSHPLGWQPLGAADFNLDGTTDVAWHNPTTNNIDVWLLENGQWSASYDIGSHPPGIVGRSAVLPLPPQFIPVAAVGVGDFDHNGVADIMWRDVGSNRIENWLLDYS